MLVPPNDVLHERDDDEGDVGQVRQQEIAQADEHGDLEEGFDHAACAPSSGMPSIRASAASRNRSPPAA